MDGHVHLGVDDLFVMKLNHLGEWLWTHQRGAGGEEATGAQGLFGFPNCLGMIRIRGILEFLRISDD